jgi:hypothetical protein
MKYNSSIVALAIFWSVFSSYPASSQTNNNTAIEALHDALKLAPNQELAWMKYKKGLMSASDIQNRRAAAAKLFPSINAVRRMQLAKAELTQESADLEIQSQALEEFYKTLTPEQQRIFDLKTLPPQQGPQMQR